MTVSELGVFAGRVAECDAVGAALDELATGARVMTVTGDPGLGKTRLLDEAARMAAARGFVVLRGQASRQRGAAFTDALHEHRDGLDRLRAASGDDPYRAVRALLEELASPGLALLLDDLHHADDGTMDLVAALLRHPPRASVLVVLAYRPRQAPLPLREAVEGRLAPVDRLRLEPLAEADVRTLLGARDTPSRRRMLHRRSGGNPLYLGGVSDCVHEVCTCAVEVPAALRVNVAAELADLPAIAGNLARAVSVLDGPFGIDLSTDLAELARPEVIAAMDDLVRADLVRPVTGTALFDFRHPLVRQVLYESVDPAWRIAAHTRAAQVLQVRRASVVTLGRHLEFAVSAGDPRGIASLVEAARVVRPQDPAIAVRWLQRALRLIPAEGLGPAVPNRADVLISLAGALAVTGKLDASRAALHEARGLVQPGAPGRSGRALALCALVERLLGRDAEARALLLRELSAPTGGDPELAFAFASGELVRGRLPSGREWAERALAGARLRRSRTLTASAQGLLAMAETFAGALETAGTHASAAADLVDGLIDGEFRQRPDVAVWLGWAELLLERPEAALRHLDRALDAGRAGGNVLLLPYVQVGRALVLRALGRLSPAASAADEALLAARQGAGAEQLVLALATRGWIATWQGDRKLALEACAAAVQWRSRPPGPWVVAFARRTAAEARLANGEPEAGLDLLAGPDLGGADPWSAAEIRELLTRAELARGDRDAAARWAAQPAGSELPGRQGFARLALAHVAEPATALEHALAARERFETAGACLDAVRARLVAGIAAASAGEHEFAAAELRAAQNAFEGAGAGYWSRRAVAERRRLAGRSPRRTGDGTAGQRGVAGLSDRERQVAELVSDGLTNRRIAQRLFVTVKTVEMHLSNIFAKLGASSRVEVAGAFREWGGTRP